MNASPNQTFVPSAHELTPPLSLIFIFVDGHSASCVVTLGVYVELGVVVMVV